VTTDADRETSGCACRSSSGRSDGEPAVFMLLAAALFGRWRAAKRANPRRETAICE
jgi:MYXO-CTERM domain-containing protein